MSDRALAGWILVAREVLHREVGQGAAAAQPITRPLQVANRGADAHHRPGPALGPSPAHQIRQRHAAHESHYDQH